MEEPTFPLPCAALPVRERSVVTPVFVGGGGGGFVVRLALLVANALPAKSVPLTVAALVIAWFCVICTVKLMRTNAPGSICPRSQEKVTIPGPPEVHVPTPLETMVMFAIGRSVAVPPLLVAAAPACEKVNVVFVGALVTWNVPLNEGSSTPAICT